MPNTSNEPRSVRQLASEILFKVDTRQAYADLLLDQALNSTTLDPRDRALLTELTYGTLRWRAKIDARLNLRLRRKLAATDALVRNLLRVTVYQLFFLDKIPDYAAVNEAVELAKSLRGARIAGFVNGVLRSVLRGKDPAAARKSSDNTVAALAVDYSHPEWLVMRWLDEFGRAEAGALMDANNARAPLVLRANRLKCSRDALLAQLREHGIAASAALWSPQGIVLDTTGAVDHIPGFTDGLFQVQGESSQLVAYLLAPAPGERILDACAAPGGKTTHIAELMDDRGEVIAIDISPRGIDRIRENANRLSLKSIRVARADSRNPSGDAFKAPYDRILVDAPCSGLGTLRSHPEIKWRRNESDIKRLSELQSEIIEGVAGYLKPDGVLVYSTCTLTRDENQRVVETFLAQHKEFELADASRYLPAAANQMVSAGYFHALPQRDNSDGFFAARMRKVS